MTELTLSGIGVFYSILTLGIAVFAVIFFLKLWYNKLSKEKREASKKGKHLPKGIHSRNKYKDLDVFAMSKPIWIFGLAIAMCVSLSAFSWVSPGKEIYIPESALILDDEVEVIRTKPPKPKPPPPPPPPPIEIQEVENEEIVEEPAFESMEIDADTEIVEIEEVKEEIPVPAPPLPPPAIEEEPDFFIVAEEMPRFPGCEEIEGTKEEKRLCAEKKMLEFLYSKVKYPQIAKENGIEGKATLQFVVDSHGNVTKANIVRNVPGGCGEEALRVVNIMPKWIPGKQRGRAVSVLYTLPVTFELHH